MAEYMMLADQLWDTVRHKHHINRVGAAMSAMLWKNGERRMAALLLYRCVVHDMSKFFGKELCMLASLPDRKKNMSNASYIMGEAEKAAIALHWSRNRHHPEYHSDLSQMRDLDMIEMVVDWAARSLQFGTALLPYVHARQENRFHFPQAQFDRILHWCTMADEIIGRCRSKKAPV